MPPKLGEYHLILHLVLEQELPIPREIYRLSVHRNSMQNIDPIYMLQPLIIVVLVLFMLIYYWRRSQLTKWVMLYSLLAYFIAIIVKIIFQTITMSGVIASDNPPLLGLYYGLQTVFLEVGLAYVFARYAVSKTQFEIKQAPSYGAGLAFWENGVLLGMISLFNLVVIFALFASGLPGVQQVYDTLIGTQPALFYPPMEALPIVALGTLERISSIIVHFAWGYLCVVAAVTGQRKYFYVALPMGFLDFFVVFSGVLTLIGLEALIFAWAIVCLAIAKFMTRDFQHEIRSERVANQEKMKPTW